MRDRERQVIGDATAEVEVFLAEAIEIARQKEDRPEHVAAERHRYPQRRADAKPPEQLTADAARLDFDVSIVDHVRAASELVAVAAGHRHRCEEALVLDSDTGNRVHAERGALLFPRGDRQDVVRQPATDDIGYLPEDV